jgi:hypothetical protein
LGLIQFKTVYVSLQLQGYVCGFEALRYEADRYVVRGPNEDAEEKKITMKVDPANVTI